MPEMNKQSKYWGNARYDDIPKQERAYVNISSDIAENTDITRLLTEQNVRFSARNNDGLKTASLTYNKSDQTIIMNTLKVVSAQLHPNMDMQDKSFGNTKYGDIDSKAFITVSSKEAAKINIGKLLNENAIQFSAHETSATQTTSITINKSDYEKVDSLIKNAIDPSREQLKERAVEEKQRNNDNTVNQPQQKHSKVVVSLDMRNEIGKQLLDRDISFSSSVNTQNRTAAFTVNSENMPLIDEILKNISEQVKSAKQEVSTENIQVEPERVTVPINSNEAEAGSVGIKQEEPLPKEPEYPEDEKERKMTVASAVFKTIAALNEFSDKIDFEVLSRNIENSHYTNPIEKAVALLHDIDKNTYRAENNTVLREAKTSDIDMGKTVSPILSAVVDNLNNSLNRTSEKIDTLHAKIDKNHGRIDKLTARANTLSHTNSLLTALKNAVPFMSGLANKLIEQNNKEIEKINNTSIPKCKAKIAKHESKIEKNNIKLSKTMTKIKNVSALNKVVANFMNTNKEERRAEFISGLTTLAQSSMDNAIQKRDTAISELLSAAENAVKPNRISIGNIIKRNEDISSLTDIIEKHQSSISKAEKLIENLNRVMNGELLQGKTEMDNVIDRTGNAVVEAISEISGAKEQSIETIADNTAEKVVEIASDVVEQTVNMDKSVEKEVKTIEPQTAEKDNPIRSYEETVEVNANFIDGIINNLPVEESNSEDISEKTSEAKQPENNKLTSLFSIEQNGDYREYINNDNSIFDLAKILAAAEHPYADLMNCGQRVSEEDFAYIQQSEKFDFSVEINIDNNTMQVYDVGGGISEESRTDENCSITSYSIDKVVDLVKSVCSKTPDISIQEQLFNENLSGCIKEIDNPIKSYEEMVEVNSNVIDGVINNTPIENENPDSQFFNNDKSSSELVREERPENPERPNLRELGAMLGISHTAVRKKYKKILSKLRKEILSKLQ